MEMRNFIVTTIREYLNENIDILPDYINIDGEKYSTKNSNGEFIAKDSDSIINFYKWFGNSKTVDSKQRPLVFYHVSNSNFNEFTPSKFGKMGSGIYFTSFYNDIKIHNKSGGSIIYKCYLKIENPYYATDDDNERLAELDDPEASKEFTQNLIDEGYDGVYYDGNLRGETVVFDSSQIWLIRD